MTRHVRSWALAAVAAFALAGAATPSLAGITYNVTNYADGQNGWTLAGTITASGEGTFTSASAITAWDITLSKPSTGSYQFTNALAGRAGKLLSGTLTASAGTLDIAGEFIFHSDGFIDVIQWQQHSNSNPYSAYVNYSQVFGPSDFSPTNSNGWRIGTATPSGVPEIDPATGSSALSLVAGVLAMIEQRRRRAAILA